MGVDMDEEKKATVVTLLGGLKAFLTDLIDNDTVIIVGVLLLACSGDADIQKLVIGGLLGYMGAKVKA